MTVLIIVVAFAVLVPALCALAEAVLYSTRMGTLEVARTAGKRAALAERLIDLKRKIAVPIAAIVIMNTLGQTAGATLAGFYAAEVLDRSTIPLFSIVMTLLVLFLGDSGPKTLGAVHWRSLWPWIVWPVIITKYAFYPAVLFVHKFNDLLVGKHKSPQVTEDEILAVVRMGVSEGQITHGESMLVHNIINLEDKPVRQIMTPRTVIFSLNADMPVKDAVNAVDRKGFTRIPIYEGDSENIIGYVVIHDLLSIKTLSQPEAPIRSIAKPIVFVPATQDSLAILTTFLKTRRHIAVVVDEYGGVAGLVTLEDLIETLLGNEIVDETDRVVDLQERARQLRPQSPDS